MRQASTATQKQSPGVDGARTGIGASELRAEQRLQQIGLLGFRRQAGGGAAALNVADHEREFDGNGQAHGFGLERHAGTGRGGDAERAGVGRADRRSDRGDFVFGLKGDHAEILVLESSCRMSDAGVIGYEPRNSGRPALSDAATNPIASAWLPLRLRYVPGESLAGGIS